MEGQVHWLPVFVIVAAGLALLGLDMILARR